MPLTKIADFKIERLEILGADGRCDEALVPVISKEKMLEIYRMLVLIRVFDEKAFKLQRQGRLGTYPQILGQEATQIVPPMCLEKKDWLIPTYRGQGSYFARGMPLVNSLLYWGGDDRGAKLPDGQNDMIFAIPVGSHLTHAVGVAMAAQYRKDSAVALTYLGDGASSKGDFYEAMNFAGVYKAPVIFFVENNQWAISVSRKTQTSAQTIAQKAIGCGLSGIQVDGNDVFAVYRAVQEAIARARRGDGASVIEAETYRLGDHTTADDSSRYRSKEEIDLWKDRDPIARFRVFLTAQNVLTEDADLEVRRAAEEKVRSAIDEYESVPEPNPLSMFELIYGEPTWNILEQRAEFERYWASGSSRRETLASAGEGRFP
ncbi:MAG: pyruvate dehydrogenase (acetyl-transferring) E1 component subunit alpha [Elusimicrobia bacterium]|nr:pyruvate dehydrogenase (acetyl-transferring) E1 component subunit alpha [Elusimicrobiota bacterium]